MVQTLQAKVDADFRSELFLPETKGTQKLAATEAGTVWNCSRSWLVSSMGLVGGTTVASAFLSS